MFARQKHLPPRQRRIRLSQAATTPLPYEPTGLSRSTRFPESGGSWTRNMVRDHMGEGCKPGAAAATQFRRKAIACDWARRSLDSAG